MGTDIARILSTDAGNVRGTASSGTKQYTTSETQTGDYVIEEFIVRRKRNLEGKSRSWVR